MNVYLYFLFTNNAVVEVVEYLLSLVGSFLGGKLMTDDDWKV